MVYHSRSPLALQSGSGRAGAIAKLGTARRGGLAPQYTAGSYKLGNFVLIVPAPPLRMTRSIGGAVPKLCPLARPQAPCKGWGGAGPVGAQTQSPFGLLVWSPALRWGGVSSGSRAGPADAVPWAAARVVPTYLRVKRRRPAGRAAGLVIPKYAPCQLQSLGSRKTPAKRRPLGHGGCEDSQGWRTRVGSSSG